MTINENSVDVNVSSFGMKGQEKMKAWLEENGKSNYDLDNDIID